MKALVALFVLVALPAYGQSRTNAAVAAGPSGVKSLMQPLGYKGIHDLQRAPDGGWTGKATRNGVPTTVTVTPDGRTISR
jgi:hypothetical protein